MKTIKFLLSALIVMLSVGASFSQVTTSSMTGVVFDADGGTLPGATVVAIHTESSSQYASVTNADGRYFLQGMRPGGPYTVTIQFVGMKPSEHNDIYLPLGETTIVDATLQDENTEI